MNCDVKILAEVLALRLGVIMQEMISTDQTGFILGRHSFTNIHHLLNIIFSAAASGVPEVVVSLDVEKVFDGVEWEYLFKCLKKFGFGPNSSFYIILPKPL